MERFLVIKKWWTDKEISCRLCGVHTDKYRVVFDETGMNVEYYCKPCFDKHTPRKINTGCIVGCDNCNPITSRTIMDCADGLCRCPDCWREWKDSETPDKEKME